MKKIFLSLFIFAVILFCCGQSQAAYNPVISGNFESGDRLYTDLFDEGTEEMIDKYYYKRFWLKYKKKLSTAEYYYLKLQYYKKNYKKSDTYNNIGLDLWGNYTHLISDKLRGRWKINIKDKDYYTNQTKSYQAYRLKYELDYDYSDSQDYGIYIQRQWNDFLNLDTKDYFRDKINIEWDYDYSDKLEINTAFQYQRQIYNSFSESSNKYGKEISIGFKYEL